ncbi:MAG: hypothetical protein IT518_29275 [Burkholderiales bacterium]|nr:hypothetical protein [Burkholderiales bacterium]
MPKQADRSRGRFLLGPEECLADALYICNFLDRYPSETHAIAGPTERRLAGAAHFVLRQADHLRGACRPADHLLKRMILIRCAVATLHAHPLGRRSGAASDRLREDILEHRIAQAEQDLFLKLARAHVSNARTRLRDSSDQPDARWVAISQVLERKPALLRLKSEAQLAGKLSQRLNRSFDKGVSASSLRRILQNHRDELAALRR